MRPAPTRHKDLADPVRAPQQESERPMACARMGDKLNECGGTTLPAALKNTTAEPEHGSFAV